MKKKAKCPCKARGMQSIGKESGKHSVFCAGCQKAHPISGIYGIRMGRFVCPCGNVYGPKKEFKIAPPSLWD